MYVKVNTPDKKLVWKRCDEFDREIVGHKPYFWRFPFPNGSSKWIIKYDPKARLWELKNDMWKTMGHYETPLLAMELADDITAHELSIKKNKDCQ